MPVILLTNISFVIMALKCSCSKISSIGSDPEPVQFSYYHFPWQPILILSSEVVFSHENSELKWWTYLLFSLTHTTYPSHVILLCSITLHQKDLPENNKHPHSIMKVVSVDGQLQEVTFTLLCPTVSGFLKIDTKNYRCT
jgi:hypothetical protein